MRMERSVHLTPWDHNTGILAANLSWVLVTLFGCSALLREVKTKMRHSGYHHRYLWIDPFISQVVAAMIMIGAWRIFKDSVNLLLQAVTADIYSEEVSKYLSKFTSVEAVHDLHICAFNTSETALKTRHNKVRKSIK